jgi:uncharacterized membrane protein
MKPTNSTRFISGKQKVMLSAVAMLLLIFGVAFLTLQDTKTKKGKLQEQEQTQGLIMIPCFLKYLI